MGSAFTNYLTTFGNGWAHLTSATAPADTYQARWNQPDPGHVRATAAAFFADLDDPCARPQRLLVVR